MAEFRVEISRPVVPVQIIKGLKVYEDTGFNYVDVYFPDGSQRTWGYISRTPQPGEIFTALAGCKQGIANAIQQEINRMLGVADGPDYHEIIEEPEEDEPTEEEDNEE